MAEMVGRKFYESPPVVERAVSIFATIDPETYEKQIPAWEALMRDPFPDYEPVTQWKLNVKQQQDGAPIFDPSSAEIIIHHRFWRKSPQGKRRWCIQVRPERLTVNLVRVDDDGRKFEEISDVIASWLPRWVETFKVDKLHGVKIEYVNVISARVTPQFVTKEGGIRISDVFRLFSGVPMVHEGLAPPYECQMTIVCDKKLPCYLTVHVFGSEYAGQPAIQIRFSAWTNTLKKILAFPELADEVAFAHSKIVEAFENLFTPEAKKSFSPQ